MDEIMRRNDRILFGFLGAMALALVVAWFLS